MKIFKKKKKQPHTLPRVAWHQWSVVRLAAIAILTVVSGYLTAAVLAVKSIDHLLHIVHDASVEQALRSGLEGVKDAYKTRQELLRERLERRLQNMKNLDSNEIDQVLHDIHTSTIMKQDSWSIVPNYGKTSAHVEWLSRSELAVKSYIVKFNENLPADEYRRSEEVLQRYQVIGLELRERIRPALIKALSITLAIMCGLLMIAFSYMAIRSKTRIEKLVKGFIQYAERDDSFRFQRHWHNELGLLSRQFNHMADELLENRRRAMDLEKLASWQTIARKMAHEIKNPLTPIQIMIGQVKRHYEGDDIDFSNLLEKAHTVILEEVASLRRMVDDFSQFAQLPSPRFNSTDAVHCAKQTIALAEGSYAPHVIVYEGTEMGVEVQMDEQLMRHALHNLIKNAAEADPEQSTPIILRLKDSSSEIIYEVEDHGPGIPESLRNNVFEAYVTTKHTGPNPGMGLGLAICQKIVLEHGGKLSLSSVPGRTIFSISIPKQHKGVQP